MSQFRSQTSLHPHPLRSNPVLLEDTPEYLFPHLECSSTTSTSDLSQARRQSPSECSSTKIVVRIPSDEIFPSHPYRQGSFVILDDLEDAEVEKNKRFGLIVPSDEDIVESKTSLPQQRGILEQSRPYRPSPLRRSTSLPTLSPTQQTHFQLSHPMRSRNERTASSSNLSTSAEAEVQTCPIEALLARSLKVSTNISRLLNLKVNLDNLYQTHSTLLQSNLSGSTISRRHSHSHSHSGIKTLRGFPGKRAAVPTRRQIEELEGSIKQIRDWQKDVGWVVERFKARAVEGGMGEGRADGEDESGVWEGMLDDGERFVESMEM